MLFKYWDKNVLFFLCLVSTSIANAEQSIANSLNLTDAQLKHYETKNFKILGVLQLKSNIESEHRLVELSGIAWDHDEQSLIVLSDRGVIIHTKPVFNKNELIDLNLLSLHPLLDVDGKKLKHKFTDSEGVALINSRNNRYNDTELLISFERKPRIIRYTTEGKFILKETINNNLNDIDNYQSQNKALEAITLHDQFNIITAPERPLDHNNNLLSLHSLNDEQWLLEPDNKKYSSLVGLTTLPNNQIIALERSFPGVFAGVTNVIRLLTLEKNSIKQEMLVKLQPDDGYFNENFEGISWHKKNRFFMVSDDNDNIFQRTLLIYFEILALKNIEEY
ncbi:MAG: hypothetical protein HND53_10510 [Proteobacteria bacterium]|nr:esterase-like activity of phytase family protein [Pseudomonadota bacterium]NOG60923.1 hypothetical protein [Pseudomonadota bacterium]